MSLFQREFSCTWVCILALLIISVSQTTVEAVRVRSTTHDLSLEVGRDEVCMYTSGLDFNEGAMLHYRVVFGGDDFDVYIRDPRNRTVYVSYAGEHEAEERVYFTKHQHGEYSYCIDNRPYTGEAKTIKMNIGLTSLKRWKDRIDPLTKVMRRADGIMLGLHQDQILFRIREQTLREGVEESKQLLLRHGVAETVVIIVVSLLNVILIKHMLARKGMRAVA